jgi:hypothetical protein
MTKLPAMLPILVLVLLFMLASLLMLLPVMFIASAAVVDLADV